MAVVHRRLLKKKRRRSIVGLMLQHIPFKMTRALGEMLDAHRKRQQALHPELTLTGMYNVLEKLRAGEPLTAKERTIHDQGQVSVLKRIHDDLDAAVFACYGWSPTLTDEEILQRLVALNAERAAEEKRGIVRWLRPEFQNPTGQSVIAAAASDAAAEPPRAEKSAARAWPPRLVDQVQCVRETLGAISRPETAKEIAGRCATTRVSAVAEILVSLETIGRARRVGADRYVSSN